MWLSIMHLILRDITKKYNGIKVLRRINLKLERNQCLSIVGPSGCGKTTLLKIIARIERQDSGSVKVNSRNQLIPIVWQDHRLLPWLTVSQNISFGLELIGVNLELRKKLVKKYINLTNLNGYENHFMHQISEGMKKRVAIARALAIKPEIILLDEPFSSLDLSNKLKMYKQMKQLQENLKLSIILVTHDTRDALLFSDKIVIMSNKPSTIIREFDNNKNFQYDNSYFASEEREIWHVLKGGEQC